MKSKRGRGHPKHYSDEVIHQYSKTTTKPYECLKCDFKTPHFRGMLKHHTDVHGSHTLTKPRKPTLALAAVPFKPAGRNGRNGNHTPETVTIEHWHVCPRCGLDLAFAAKMYAYGKTLKEV